MTIFANIQVLDPTNDLHTQSRTLRQNGST